MHGRGASVILGRFSMSAATPQQSRKQCRSVPGAKRAGAAALVALPSAALLASALPCSFFGFGDFTTSYWRWRWSDGRGPL